MSAETVFRIVLAIQFILDVNSRSIGFAMLASLWLPAPLIALEWVIQLTSGQGNVSFSHLMKMTPLIPFIQIIINMKQLSGNILEECNIEVFSGYEMLPYWTHLVVIFYSILREQIKLEGTRNKR